MSGAQLMEGAIEERIHVGRNEIDPGQAFIKIAKDFKGLEIISK